MGFQINEHVTWVGKIDWERRRFHGEEYSAQRGSSYNSYLIRDEKTALIDTVWTPFAKEFVAKLKQEIDLRDIDYIIINHGEDDHSGALPELMAEIPDTPIYCSSNAAKTLKGLYHKDWNFRVIKADNKLSLGKMELTFIDMTMLTWPDSMACYLSGDEILFSSNLFGQHFASNQMFNDLVDQTELFQEALKYFAILFSSSIRLVDYKIKEMSSLSLPIGMICPSHGVMWRDNPQHILESHMKWASAYQENQITVLYDTMGNSTYRMAEAIIQGIQSIDSKVVIKCYNVSKTDKADMITEIFKSKAILIGSPTVNKGILSSIAALLEAIQGMGFKGKKAASFGAYGWSGESARFISKKLQESGLSVINFMRMPWNPDEAALKSCEQFGRDFVTRL